MRERLRSAAARSMEPGRALAALEELADCRAPGLDACPGEFLARLADLLVISPPMLDALRRHPEWTVWLAQAAENPADARTRLREWRESREAAGDFLEDLRAFQRRACLEIAFRDLAGLDSFEETTGRLSDLADLVLEEALEHCRVRIAAEEGGRPAGGFAIFALGKLGGRELNYSSDIDLIFCRRNSQDKEEARFFTRLGETLARELGRAGPEGFLYRVDLRLRPYGAAGPLVPTLDSLTTYYESWGEAWERQALIKMRPAAGDRELGRRFVEFAERYVFARPMDDAALEEIKTVKHRSEKEHARAAGAVDLKHGPGGIRDIEFYVQFHQLIAGAHHARARARGTLAALAALDEAHVLLEGELAQLSLGYLMQRTVEHRLQLRALTPRETLPAEPAELELLARGLGYGGGARAAGEALGAVLAECRARVRAIVERVYLTPGYLRLREREEEFARLLSDRTPRERVRELLAGYGFADIDRAWRNLRSMALGPDGRMLGPGERRTFLEIVFPLLEVLRDSLDPDQALHKLESFAAATGNRVSFLRALASRRAHLARLANLLALSNLCHQVLVRHPEYFDSLARGVHLHEGRTAEEMYGELANRFGASPRGDERENVIRRFRQRETVRIAYRDLAGLAGALEVSRELSDLAEACVRAAAELARAPEAAFAPEEAAPLRIVALGKMGGREMHYSSDLDLVFLYDDPPADLAPAARAALQRALDARVERFLELLAGVTSEGAAYRVDLRLRPEGSGGLLARSWEGFLDYARRHMQPWERMALVRSRMLGAPGEAERRWQAAVAEIAYGHGWDEAPFEELRRIKRRIEAEKSRESRSYVDFKYGSGGVTDMAFLVGALQLRAGARRAEVRVPEIAGAIEALGRAGVLPREEAAQLAEAHLFQRRLENRYQLMEEWAAREVSRESPALALLARSLGYGGASRDEARRRFLADWDERARFVRRMLERYL